MKDDILISIVIPIYNMESYIQSTIDSILKQSYKNFQLILVDDGSTDNSGEICDECAKKDSRIDVLHTKNQGSGPARNIGIDKAKGEYIYFPDADDGLVENALQILSVTVADNRYDLVIFGYNTIYKNQVLNKIKKYDECSFFGENIRKNYFDFFDMDSSYGIQGAPWNKLFKTKIIKENNVKYPSLRRHQDDAFIGLYMCYVDEIKFINNVLYTYYANDITKEWDKYPKDYIDSVIGLYNIRKNSILKWNKDDLRTHMLVERAYITSSIKAMELSFSQKYGLNKKRRKQWIIDLLDKTNLKDVNSLCIQGMKYQTKIMCCIKKEKYNALYFHLRLKVFFQKNLGWLYYKIKRLANKGV